MSKRFAQRGITLFEVLVAIAIAGLMAVITIPKISTPLEQRQSTIVGRADSLKTQMVLVYSAADDDGGVTTPYLDNFREFGSFLAIKDNATATSTATGASTYALLGDGSRVIFNADLLDEYGITATEIDKLKASSGAGNSRCGDFADAECFFLDINGEKVPNTFGKRGDLVPFRMDPDDGTIKTLYKWEKDAGQPLCRYESSFDFFSDESVGCT